MDWMRQKDNPYFARAFVNRVWANYFGVGLIDPPDDMNLANPPSNAALLDYLADGFVDHGFDMKWLHREIVTQPTPTSGAGGRTRRTGSTSGTSAARSCAGCRPRSLFDALALATAWTTRGKTLHDDPAGSRAIGRASGLHRHARARRYAVKLFGSRPRTSTATASAPTSRACCRRSTCERPGRAEAARPPRRLARQQVAAPRQPTPTSWSARPTCGR